MRRYVLCLLSCVVLGLPDGAAADVISLEPVADATLFSEAGDRSAGGDTGLFVGITNAGAERRSLLRFDLAGAMPAGSTISAVSLELKVTQSAGADFDGALHIMSDAFGEGTVVGTGGNGGGGPGGPAQVGDSTWTRRVFDTVSWATAGGDFAVAASATSPIPSLGNTASFGGAQLVADVQSWLDTPASNLGWIMLPVGAGAQQARRFASREANVDRPQLVITFDPPVTTGACCALSGACTVVDDPGGACTGTYQGLGVACSVDLCPAPTGACCMPNAQASCQVETALDCLALGGSYRGDDQLCAEQSCPVVLEPFVDPLPVPRTAVPTSGQAGAEATYHMSIVQLSQKMHRDLPATTLWGYDDGMGGSHPGPTIEAASGAAIELFWRNDLRDSEGALLTEHALPVDTCPHGADDASARSVTHLHGGHVAAASDGYPEDTILPGEEVRYDYPNIQSAATLWYHDHAVGITRLNVYMGLAGLYLVRDAVEDALNLPSGDYEVPLFIQDKSFEADGSLRYPSAWDGHVVHSTILVNGKVWPFMEVDKGKYRFRVLNGSGTRTYRLKLSDGKLFSLIGTDGGLLPEAIDVSSVVVSPGERVEIVIDFRSYVPGSEIILTNDAPSPFPGTPGQGVVPEVMKFIVGPDSGELNPLPTSLRPVEPLSQSDIAEERDFVLNQMPDPCSGGNMWFINGLGWHEITEKPRLGTTEIWRFINDSGMMHPMHMHLVFFQILDKQEFDIVDGEVVPVGDLIPLAPNEGGWQDTVQVAPGEMVRVIAKFEDFTGRFAYHCHILEHEDHEMMRQFETYTVCGDGVLGKPDEACDTGGESAYCNQDCTLAACGDGVLNVSAGEECDDGNALEDDECSAACQLLDIGKDEDSGCGCGSGSSSSSGGFLVFGFVLFWLRRRRRSA